MWTLLGHLALLEKWGRRRLGNPVPLTTMVWLFGCWVLLQGLSGYLESSSNPAQPRELSVAAWVKDPSLSQTYVRLQGVLAQSPLLELGQRREPFYILKDLNGPEAVLMRLPRPDYPFPPVPEIQVVGTFRLLSAGLASSVPKPRPDLNIDPDQFLEVGQKPPSLYASTLLIGAGLLLSLPFMVVAWKRGLMFRARPEEAPQPRPLKQTLAVQVSGRLTQAKRQTHCLEYPAQVVARSGGRLEVRTQSEPAWTLEIDPSQVQKCRAGTVFLTGSQRPALQVRFSTSWITLSLESQEDLGTLWAALQVSPSAEKP